jgi:predicted membrane protein
MESKNLASMDPKDVSAFLAPSRMTIREKLLALTGGVIGLLSAAVCNLFYQHNYRRGLLQSVVPAVLILLFFRKRKLALIISSAGTLFAFGALSFWFHASFPALIFMVSAAAVLYLTILWTTKRYPYLSYRHKHTVFKSDQEMDVENTRLERESREFNKDHPFGPWIFR